MPGALVRTMSLVAGIRPAEPGFKSVLVEPHPGPLNHIDAEMDHPAGRIEVNLRRERDNRLVGEVTLPEDLTGSFVWDGETKPLLPGRNIIGGE